MKKNNDAKTDDLAIRDKAGVPAELKDKFDLKANMEGVAPRLPQVRILHQARLYEMPDGEQHKEFQGIILDTNRINAWWEIPFDESGGGTPPQCFSMNGIEPEPGCEKKQNDSCIECELNKFGSDGRGKACKNMKRVHIVLEGQMLPHRLTLPPSNLKAIDIFISLLTSQGMPYQLVVTNFKLKEAQNKEGIKYSEVDLEVGGYITDSGKAENLKRLRREMKAIMRGQEILFGEYVTPDEEL